MRFYTPLALAAMVPALLAQPIHEHHVHKREAAIETVTAVVYVNADGSSPSTTTSANGDTSIVLVASPSTKAATTDSYNAQSSFSTVLYSNTEAVSNSAVISASSTASPSSTAPSTSAESSAVNSDISFAAGAKGITYSPYTNTGACKDASTVQSDIAKLTQFDIIRLYDTDCSCVENVLAAKQPNQKIFAGIFYLDKISQSVSIIQNAVNGNWNDIDTVSIGNELVNSGEKTPADIKAAVASARTALSAAGYSGNIVSVDTLVAVQNNPELCDYSDYVAVNSHPFWDGSVLPEDSGSFLKTQIANIKNTCGGKKQVVITETGWPTKGDNYGSAIPSVANQKTAVKAIVDEVGNQAFVFTTYNDLWKSPGDYGVEQYWGIIQD